MNEILIAVVPSVILSLVTYILTKKKYDTEVDAGEIQNMRNSLEFYVQIIESHKAELASYLEMAKENREEIRRLREGIDNLLKHSCVVKPCKKRKRIPEDEVEKYLKEDEVKSEEKVLS